MTPQEFERMMRELLGEARGADDTDPVLEAKFTEAVKAAAPAHAARMFKAEKAEDHGYASACYSAILAEAFLTYVLDTGKEPWSVYGEPDAWTAINQAMVSAGWSQDIVDGAQEEVRNV